MSASLENGLTGVGPIATWLLATQQSLRLLMRNRILWLLFFGQFVTGIIAWGVAGRENLWMDGFDLFCSMAWWFQVWVLLPWATIYLSVHAVAHEIEERTVQYLFLRPVRRAPILLGRWTSAALLSFALTACGTGLIYLGVADHPERWNDGVDRGVLFAFLEVLGWGTGAYAAFGVCFAACCRRPLVWGAVFVVLQMVVGLLPVSAGVRALTVTDPMHRRLVWTLEPDRQLEEMLWPGESGLYDDLIGNPLMALAVLTAVLLLFALYRYGRAEYLARKSA